MRKTRNQGWIISLVLLLTFSGGTSIGLIYAQTIPETGTNSENESSEERVKDTSYTINVGEQGDAAEVYESIAGSRFYIAPIFNFIPLESTQEESENSNNEVPLIAKYSEADESIKMNVQIVTSPFREEVATKLSAKIGRPVQIANVGNLKLHQLSIELLEEKSRIKYGTSKYDLPYPSSVSIWNVSLPVRANRGKELANEINHGNITLRLSYAYNRIDLNYKKETLRAGALAKTMTYRNLKQEGKDLMTSDQTAEAVADMKKEIVSEVYGGFGNITPESLPIDKLMTIFDVGKLWEMTNDQLSAKEVDLIKRFDLKVKPEDFQPYRYQKKVKEMADKSTDIQQLRQDYSHMYDQEKDSLNVTASASAKWGWGKANAGMNYSHEAEKVRDKTQMSDDKFCDFLKTFHGVEYDKEEREYRGIKLGDLQKIDAKSQLEICTITIKPMVASGIKNRDMTPSAQVIKYLSGPGLNPPGTIVAFSGPEKNIPLGWLPCKGQVKNIAEYRLLFRAIGYTWGKGKDDGSTFTLPELQGYFLRGVSGDSGHDPDISERTAAGDNTINEAGSYQHDNFMTHHHHLQNIAALDNVTVQHGFTYLLTVGDTSSFFGESTKANSDGGGNETRPKNAFVHWIIKY